MEEDPPAQGSRRAVDLAALDTFIEFKRRIGTAGGFNPNAEYVQQLGRLPRAIRGAGPDAHGYPHGRQAMAAALAQRRSGQDGPTLRFHTGGCGPLDHPL